MSNTKRRRGSGGILRWRASQSQSHPQLHRHSALQQSPMARRGARGKRRSESGWTKTERRRRSGRVSRLIWTRQARRRTGVRVACGAWPLSPVQKSLRKSLSYPLQLHRSVSQTGKSRKRIVCWRRRKRRKRKTMWVSQETLCRIQCLHALQQKGWFESGYVCSSPEVEFVCKALRKSTLLAWL